MGSVGAFFSKVQQSGVLPASTSAEDAAGAVLGTLAQRLSGGEVRKLLDSLLPELSALLQRYPVQRGEQGKTFGKQEFIRRVASQLRVEDEDAEVIARTVLQATRLALTELRAKSS